MMISETDRLSIQYHKNTHEEREHHSSMFIEDLSQNIVPIYGSDHEVVQCVLEPENEEFQKMLGDILPSYRTRYKENFDDIILGTIQFIAQHLVNYGNLVFELVTQKDINNKVTYKLVAIYGTEVKVEKDRIIQLIYNDSEDNTTTSQSLEIPIDKCFVINFPQILGGKEKYLKFLNEFKELGKESPFMSFARNPLRGHLGYNITEHQRLHDLELWKKSKVYNWHHRESNGKIVSGYYHIYRHLQFRKNKIELRNYIVNHLQVIISALSEKTGPKTELKIEGLTPLLKVEEALSKWKTGELEPNSIGEVL